MSGCRSIDFGCQVVDGSENQVSGHTHTWIVPGICLESQENPGYHHTKDFPYHLGRHWAVFSCLGHDPLDGIHGFCSFNHGKQ